jgi:NADH dehydrogenase
MQNMHTEESTTKKVVILGAGFGGLSAALELGRLKQHHRKNAKDFDLDIIAIDRNDFQLFTPDLYEIASASKDITDEKKLKQTVCIDVRIGLGQESVGFLQAVVESVDPTSKQVMTSKGEVDYDYLIVAPGSEAFYFGIPGMAEHSIPFKWIQDAVSIRNTIQQLMEEKDQVHVIVCGAGPAGVELAAELRTMCERVMSRQCFALTLVEGRDTILSLFGTRVQKAGAKRLKELGITVKTNFVISAAEDGKVKSKTGEILKGDIIIWTGGVKASSMLEHVGLTLTKRGQVAVKRTMQSQQFDDIFVIGDAAECQVQDGVYTPMTAHEAVHQGPVAARNIFHHMFSTPLETYHMRDEGFVITMGGKNGIVVLPGGQYILKGFIGWFGRKYVDFRHFRSVLPFMQACSLWFQGMKIMNKNDPR